ncbi:MAG: hypothetical protein Fur0022_41320 [Anaerolineales bacterium]
MKNLLNKRTFLIHLLLLCTMGLFVPSVFAAPLMDAFVPTPTPTVTLVPTNTPVPTAPPEPTQVPPTATTQSQQVVEVTQTQTSPSAESNVPEQTTNNAAGSSVLAFLLCAGVIIVAGLATLNIWARRKP